MQYVLILFFAISELLPDCSHLSTHPTPCSSSLSLKKRNRKNEKKKSKQTFKKISKIKYKQIK